MTTKTKLTHCFAVILLGGDRRTRQFILKVLDIGTFLVAIYWAAAIRLETLWPLEFLHERNWQVLFLLGVKSLIFERVGLYQPLLRYSNLGLATITARAVGISTVSLITLSYFAGYWALGRSILIIDALLTLTLVVSTRLLLQGLIRKTILRQKRAGDPTTQPTRLLVYGAGAAGVQLLQSLATSYRYQVVGFVDDNPALQRKQCIDGLTVYSPQHIPYLYRDRLFDTVVLAMPSVSQRVRSEICDRLQQLSIPIKTVPTLDDILSGTVTIQEIRDIDVMDLLGREEVQPHPQLLRQQIADQVVLVTGAGGSIGSELCRQIAQQGPRQLILFELSEFALYTIHQELTETHPELDLVPVLGNVADQASVCRVLREYQVDTIYHAAAYKHVPLLESNILKGIENNVLGTLSVGKSALACGVKQFVLISTDKAVRPTNIMGTTKRIAELIIQALGSEVTSHTSFAIVRFGNVLGSSGSVVPRFRKQIAQGGPITLTHPDITRYFMSIPEAARLVIQAGAMATGVKVFLLDMGKPVKIYHLAEQMIRLSGLIPHEDIQINITGLRPGEKLYEELLIAGDNVHPTDHSKIYCADEYYLPWSELEPLLNELINLTFAGNIAAVRHLLQVLVPEYHRPIPTPQPVASTTKPALPVRMRVNSLPRGATS
jgi:FlaA1/EpsC-like NDP-sugar epimerase